MARSCRIDRSSLVALVVLHAGCALMAPVALGNENAPLHKSAGANVQAAEISALLSIPSTASAAPGLTLAPATSASSSDAKGSAPKSIESRGLGVPVERRPLGTSPADPAAQMGGSLVWWVRTGFALAVVISLIFALKILYTKLARQGGSLASALGAAGRAPSGVLEVLGRYPVSKGHSLVLLRCDRRVLLLGQSSQGFRTLAEIADADDVASLLTKTRDEEGASMSSRFTEVLKGLERDPATIADERPSGPTPILREAAAAGAMGEAAVSGGPIDAADRLRRHLLGVTGVRT